MPASPRTRTHPARPSDAPPSTRGLVAATTALPHRAGSELERPVVDPKLRPALARRGLIPRPRLLDRLTGEPARLVTVTAPAGYGKSTLLAQWARVDPRPFAWVSLDDGDNDPSALLGWLAAAFHDLPGAGPLVTDRLTLARVGAMLSRCDPPPVVVVDDVHALHNLLAIDTVTDLLGYLPDGAVLALAGRSSRVNLGRLRVELDVLELGPGELALDDPEAQALFEAADVALDPAGVRRLRDRTEGWAAVLTLAASAARTGADLSVATSGDERAVAEYLHSEVMARLDPPVVEFLRRSAVLEELTGPSCDAVLGRQGSAALLESLAAQHQLVLPVGAGRERYRYHPVLRDLLLAELGRDEPHRLAPLRRRAADWCREHGDPWAAVRYSFDAGDLDAAATLVTASARDAWAGGHAATVEQWLSRLEHAGVLDSHPELAALWAVLCTLDGRAVESDRWARRAGSGADVHVDPHPMLALLQALLAGLRCADGIDRMRMDATRLLELAPPGHPWVATGLALTGIADLVEGDDGLAGDQLVEAVDLARRREATGAEIGAIGVLTLVRARQGRWDEAAVALAGAEDTIARTGFADYGLSGIVHAGAACLHDHRGDDAAREAAVSRFDVLRPRMTYAMPQLSVLARLAVARVHRRHGDWEAARTLLAELTEILARRPGLGRLVAEVDELARAIGDRRGGPLGGSTLTVAELRLLPLLPTHLSFRGIGERLFVSQHTVKTQALSIYRKLGVGSRDQAVTRARELGLLDD